MSIISLLCRISPTWTPLRSVSLAIVLGIVHVLYVTTQLYPALKALQIIVLFTFLGLLFVALCLVFMSLYDMFINRNTNQDTIYHNNLDHSPHNNGNDHSEQRFHNVVITTHMMAAFFPAVLQMIWDFFGSHWSAGTTDLTRPRHTTVMSFNSSRSY